MALSPEMINEIHKLQTLEDCQKAWKMIKVRFREIEDDYAASAITGFKIGDTVTFEGRKRQGVIQGNIVKKNLKTAKVDCGIHNIWNVAYSMLKKVEKPSKNP